MKKFLSIIIPVYNAEKYLAECLDSCLNQNIPAEDYEIICVDDGSTDGSAEILERYARERDNIKVITQPNGGVSSARNTGLDAVRGEYVWFVDPDDFVQKNCLAELRQIITETPVDKLTFGYYEFENTLSPVELEKKDAHSLLPSNASYDVAVWMCLYRHDFLLQHSLRFWVNLHFAEDMLFQQECDQYSPISSYHPKVFYFYRRNPASITRALTPEARRIRMEAPYLIGLRLADSAKQKRMILQETCAERDQYTSILMPAVRKVTTLAASLSAEHRRGIINSLSDADLFPLFLYPNPRDWFPKKIHMNHSNTNIMGKLVDILFFYSTTRLGFAALVLYYKLYHKHKGREY